MRPLHLVLGESHQRPETFHQLRISAAWIEGLPNGAPKPMIEVLECSTDTDGVSFGKVSPNKEIELRWQIVKGSHGCFCYKDTYVSKIFKVELAWSMKL